MRKKISLILLSIVVGVSLALAGNLISPASASSARTIDMKYGTAIEAVTQITTGSGILYYVSGMASGSSNATYSVHDAASTTLHSNDNVMAEGGEVSQYDSFPTLDFGNDGLPFVSGLVVSTTTCSVAIQYR